MNSLCAKEYTRRLSGNVFNQVENLDKEETQVNHPKKPADSASNFLNSPRANGETTTPDFIQARERANSAFKKFDSKPEEPKLQHRTTTLKGTEAEPSFGANSKQA